ncbi:ATP-binding protein [Alsobacter sp. SYSU M60028]|uniref:histidine kinase n=1 Tax=Alsobacter ponti TaxID=2962936 RepID=A0ABT1L9B4_9HYPH|nr:PAS domain-containing hybrid sensor histidine kinase/response regulator [Alsobacter ponti]MCP8938080.1 ATP-binding protein [Alsobacter ponti]
MALFEGGMDLRGGIFESVAFAAPSALTFVLGSVAVFALTMCVMLLRDHFGLERRARSQATRIESLNEEVAMLRESEERYRSLIEAQGDLIYRRDERNRLTYVNEAFALAAGRPPESLIGLVFQLPARETMPRHTGEDGSVTYDQSVLSAAGQRWISWVETRVGSGRNGHEIQVVGRDVTARRQVEAELAEARLRAEAANEAKSRFLATVSHEIRTPLNGVLGMADLLLGTGITPEQTTYVRAVKTSGEALLSIIEEILDFSRIEAGRLELSHEPFDLLALVEGTIELLAPRAQGKGVEIASLISPDVETRLMGDPARLRQVLTNLAGNAVKFTDKGGVGVRVTREGDRLRFAVCDTGVGVPHDRIGRIFDEFERVEGHSASRYGGTGLGLAISRRLVAGMGGQLSVTSEPGHGSTFSFTLPIVPAPDAGQPWGVDAGVRGQSALIVSQSPFEAPFLRQRLQAAGMDVDLVPNVASAVTALRVKRMDLLVVDGGMGEDAARTLANEGQRLGVPRRLVMLSPFERRAFGPPTAVGFDGYLVKPVRERALAPRLRAPGMERHGASVAVPPPSAFVGPAGPERHVLLAEDNDINALLTTKLLERHGAKVTWARDGLAAVDKFRACCDGLVPPFDLVLMDVRMPGLDGHDATRRIRAIEAELGRPRTRIVALSANAFEEDRRLALAAGMDDTIAKPVSEARLAETLAAAPVGAEPRARSA